MPDPQPERNNQRVEEIDSSGESYHSRLDDLRLSVDLSQKKRADFTSYLGAIDLSGCLRGEIPEELVNLFSVLENRVLGREYLDHSAEVPEISRKIIIGLLAVQEPDLQLSFNTAIRYCHLNPGDCETYKVLGRWCLDLEDPGLLRFSGATTLFCKMQCHNVAQFDYLAPWINFFAREDLNFLYLERIAQDISVKVQHGESSTYDHLLVTLCLTESEIAIRELKELINYAKLTIWGSETTEHEDLTDLEVLAFHAIIGSSFGISAGTMFTVAQWFRGSYEGFLDLLTQGSVAGVGTALASISFMYCCYWLNKSDTSDSLVTESDQLQGRLNSPQAYFLENLLKICRSNDNETAIAVLNVFRQDKNLISLL